MVSTAEIAPGDGRAGSAGVDDEAETTFATLELVELADGVEVSALMLGRLDLAFEDDPGVFAVSSGDVASCADDAEPARDCTASVFACLEPDLAPPVPTALPGPAVSDLFEVADALDPAPDAPDDAEFPLGELEFGPDPDDPVDPSAHATPYPVENSAAPTPSATANPPTRPTKREAPMIVYLPTYGHIAFAEGKPAYRRGFTKRPNCQLCNC
ncbi:hypothetical protein ACTXG7_27350 [Mycolicibacterium sp. Dal123E01]|uniref:hypothetical protein n=1 Tax=Mycolicibacterium sp. Dal123E01 TaxID=3457578 RepID=UPI00403E8D6E